jgi:putative ABC transport system permease protein
MLSLAHGFKATMMSSGSSDNAIIMRAGANAELNGAVTLDDVRLIQDAPGIARDSQGPLVTAEAVMIAPFPLVSTGTDANVQIRGVSSKALEVRNKVKITQGRFLRPGLWELVVGRNVSSTYGGLSLGSSVKFGGATWQVVGVFDAGGSAFDSEVWADASVLNQAFKRPENIFQSVTVHLTSADDFQKFKDAVTTNPQLNVDVDREINYYNKQSQTLTLLITVLGAIVSLIMAFGAVVGALNTMYSAVAERSREIATLRAVGFGAGSVVISFTVEAVLISLVGGVLGCVAVLPINGFTTSSINWQTFSNLAFAFTITPGLMFWGIVFALCMGLLGGIFPAIRAARLPVAPALRGM